MEKLKWYENRDYTLDGDPIDILDFIDVNDLEDCEVGKILKLKKGETYTFGGGAAAKFELKRTR